MTISRGQMERQLRMGGGIMDVVPREPAILGGIKRAVKKTVKKATRGVKDLISSDVGKAALAGAALYGLGGAKFLGGEGIFASGQGLQRFRNFANLPAALGFGKTAAATAPVSMSDAMLNSVNKDLSKNIITGNLGKIATLGAVTTFLTKSLGMPPEQAEEELARNPSTYLELYYRNLNPPTADTNSEQYEAQVRNFVETNISEYATGGRVGLAQGNPLPPDPTQPVNPFKPKPIGPVLPNKEMASNIENDKILEALFEKYIDMGLSPKDAAKAAQEEFDRMSNMRIEETRGVAALGGRMGFDEGTPRGLQSLMENAEQKMIIIVYDEDGNPQLVPISKSEVMNMQNPRDPDDMVDREFKARGDTASENAMQAAGVEGLPIRQNPKGVKELDLRETGGFIPPVGIKEKEDDIPAMLSNNEFVFTADAVRGMGGGDVNKGAQMLYDQMKMLEAGGKV